MWYLKTPLGLAAINDFSGQPQIIENITIFIKAAKLRGEPLDHILFHGPPRGLGKLRCLEL